MFFLNYFQRLKVRKSYKKILGAVFIYLSILLPGRFIVTPSSGSQMQQRLLRTSEERDHVNPRPVPKQHRISYTNALHPVYNKRSHHGLSMAFTAYVVHIYSQQSAT